MKAYFDFGDEFNGIVELNEENIEKATEICKEWSSWYCKYIISIEWDNENKMPHIFAEPYYPR